MALNEIDILAKKLWDYQQLHNKLEKADCIFVLGSHDLRVADYAAKLFLDGWAPIMIFSGGFAHKNDLLNTNWDKSEAEVFAERASSLGVPKEKIIVESKATNTGENVEFTEKLLKKKKLVFNSFIVVQKPYMERRAFATIKKYWPEKKLIVASPKISFENYPNEEISKEDLINLMAGDLQRIKVYPKKGFQIEQKIPADVWDAFNKLVALGYTKHLIK